MKDSNNKKFTFKEQQERIIKNWLESGLLDDIKHPLDRKELCELIESRASTLLKEDITSDFKIAAATSGVDSLKNIRKEQQTR